MLLRHRFRHEVQAYGFLGPALLLLGGLTVYPLLQVLRMSLYEVNLRTEVWVGLGNYTALLQTALFWQVLWQTTLFTGGSVVCHSGAIKS